LAKYKNDITLNRNNKIIKGGNMQKLSFYILSILIAASLVASAQTKQEKKQMKPALLVIDIQNQYLPYMSDEDKKLGLEMINWAIGLFRQYNCPVIRVYHTDPEWGPKPDTEPFEFPSSINIKPEDPKIIKNYPSAFKKTELEKLLREKECNTLYFCGLSAVGCVLATYHSAMDLDFNVFMIKDALISHNSEYTNFIEEIKETVSLNTVKIMLEYTQ
jgi:nicotinamidase-related amidase